jgi:hypothetical protein
MLLMKGIALAVVLGLMGAFFVLVGVTTGVSAILWFGLSMWGLAALLVVGTMFGLCAVIVLGLFGILIAPVNGGRRE